MMSMCKAGNGMHQDKDSRQLGSPPGRTLLTWLVCRVLLLLLLLLRLLLLRLLLLLLGLGKEAAQTLWTRLMLRRDRPA